MKAQNLTISVPNGGCDKNCPYCISKITGSIDTDFNAMLNNFPLVKQTATIAKVTDLMITGKGEPFRSPYLVQVLDMASELNLPIEIQTNGLYLYRAISDPHILSFFTSRISIFAFSVDKASTIGQYKRLFEILKREGKTVRVCINLTNRIDPAWCFWDIMRITEGMPIDQILIRNVTYPSSADKESPVVKWIDENTRADRCSDWELSCAGTYDAIRTLPLGAKVYDAHGKAVTFSNYCIEEKNDHRIRSLIFQEDGHLYTTWDSQASRLF